MDRWWKSETTMTQITDWAFELAERHPSDTLVSLGQSPSWFVFGAGMLRKMRGESANTKLVPFTRAFFDVDRDRTDSADSIIFLEKNDRLYPRQTRLDTYFNFLSMLEMQPEQMEADIQKGGSFVIAEMIKSAKGLGSFVHSWLREIPEGFEDRLGKEIKFLTYDTSQVSVRQGVSIPKMFDGVDILVPFHPMSLNADEAEIMENTAACNIAEERTSRLMPLYQMAANKPCRGLEICPNGPIRVEIKGALHESIQKRYQAEKIYPSEALPQTAELPLLEAG